MKLYTLSKRDVLVRALSEADEPFLFHHVDGMFSLCTDKHGNIFHPSASTEIEVVDMYPRPDWGKQYLTNTKDK